MASLPPDFLARMQAQLGADYPAFLDCYERPAHTGLRVNTLKLSADALRARSPFALDPVAWSPAGFRVIDADEVRPGKHPDHAAGLYYLQEPSAMAAAEVAAPRPGERVLDLAASPGGKSTHLCALMDDQGLLWANEIRTKRIPALRSNLERWGARNLVISNEPPERLADRLAGCFDVVLVDAPCSGEGMFRKEPSVALEWNAAHIPAYAERQRLILHFAARLVRPGGRLVYSTCTFNSEENEAVLADFLAGQPDFRPAAIALPGWTPAGPGGLRLWPHRAAGEGHFVARLERTGGEETWPGPSRLSPPGPAEMKSLQAFCAEFLPGWLDQLDPTRLDQRGEQITLVPADLPETAGLRVPQAGLWLGTARKGRFEPAHSLAMAVRAADCALTLDLPAGDPAVAAFLRGETLPSDGPAGWLTVCAEGFPLGWGKRVQGVVKNHLPSGLRRV